MQQTSAMFTDVNRAAAAVEELRAAGVPEDAIHYYGHDAGTVLGADVVTSEGDIQRNDEALEATKDTAGSMLAGAGIGAVLGIAALAIPGVGPAVAAGAIASTAMGTAAASGAILGGAAGGIKEALEKYYETDDAAFYSEGIERGEVLIAVDSERDDVDGNIVRDILVQHGGMRRMAEVS